MNKINYTTRPKVAPKIDKGVALCLSGGGYRAMLFHCGTLIRLAELGYLAPQKLRLVSSVSGGAITAAMLGVRWEEIIKQSAIKPDEPPDTDKAKVTIDSAKMAIAVRTKVVEPLIEYATEKTLDGWALLTGFPGWFINGWIPRKWLTRFRLKTPGEFIADYHDQNLFKGAALCDLPDSAHGIAPDFVFNATNLSTGADYRFSRNFMGDSLAGFDENPSVPLALAVAISGGFPPILGPVLFQPLQPTSGTSDLSSQIKDESDLKAFTHFATLADGGVNDNLGLEPALQHWDTILVSDGGLPTAPDPRPSFFLALSLLRVHSITDLQVRLMRRKQITVLFKAEEKNLTAEKILDSSRFRRKGAFWDMERRLNELTVDDQLSGVEVMSIDKEIQHNLANTPTRLKCLKRDYCKKLINLGYAQCDAHMRTYVIADQKLPCPKDFPYPEATMTK